MKKSAAILIAMVSIIVAEAQQPNQFYIDSIKHELTVAKEDTNKVKLLFQAVDWYNEKYPDSGIAYAQESLDLAKKINFGNGIFEAHSRLTSLFILSGNYPLAIEHGLKWLSLAKESKDSANESLANALIGECYYDLGDYNTSLGYVSENVRIAEAAHLDKIHFAWANMARLYTRMNQPDSAILYAQKAYKRVKDIDDRLFVSIPLADAYAGKASYDSALILYRVAIPISLKYHSELTLIETYNGIANVYKETGNLDSATWYSKKVLAENTYKIYPIGLLKAANLLADIYGLQNKSDSALKYLRIALDVKDILFSREKNMAIQNIAFKEQEKQNEIEASELKYQNQLKMYSLLGGLIALLTIAGILLRNNRHKQKAYVSLQNQKQETDTQKSKAEQALTELKSTQTQLIQSEKMASLGELTAGIAHEIQNPLNFVNNFSEVNTELIDELEQEADKGNFEEVKAIAKDIKENEQKINHHGKRADAIVKGMLQHSRSSSGVKEPTDINALCDEYLRLSYHGLKAKDKSFNAIMKTDFDKSIGNINIIPQDIGRVVLNLLTNAFYVVDEKKKSGIENYEPTVSISTKKMADKVEIKVSDNGNGIPQKVLDKIFQPFFTTKPTGQGTGLGLSLSYDIVTKGHGGELKVETKEGEGAEFIIQLTAL